jgi:hypothetical protein
VPAPYTLRVALDGKALKISRIKNGAVLGGVLAFDPTEFGGYDFTDPETVSKTEVTFGGRLGAGESLVFSGVRQFAQETRPPESETRSDGGYRLKVVKNGAVAADEVVSWREGPVSAPYTMRVCWAGQYLNIWYVKDGRPVYLATKEYRTLFDFRTPEVIEGFKAYSLVELSPGASLSIGRFHNYYTGGDGQADPRPLHYKDGTIIEEDGKIWLQMTTRGYQPIPASYQGIYSLDLDTYELQLASVVVFDKEDADTTLWGYHASDFVYDEDAGEWIVVTSSHGDDARLRYGKLDRGDDPRVGPFIVCRVKPVVTTPSISGTEDPALRFDPAIGKWRLISCYSGVGGFNTVMLASDTADPLGSYARWGAYQSASTTGNQLVSIGGKLYALLGRGVSRLEAVSLPAFQDDPEGGKLICELKYDALTGSNNVWPVVLSLPADGAGTEKYLMMTFDRDQVQYVSGYSYGRIYLYEADESYSPDGFPPTPTARPPAGEAVSAITSAEQLYAIRGNLAGNYALANDIDMDGFEWFPIGSKGAPFTGTLDGNGHAVYNLTADLPGLNGVGLFGYTSASARISDVSVENAKITGGAYAGILVGVNLGAISGAAVSGAVVAEAEGGLLAGRNSGAGGVIARCGASGKVSVAPGASAGGLIGANMAQGSVANSFSNADVDGAFNVGGFVGYNDRASISDCYAAGNVCGTALVGGFVGNSSNTYATAASRIARCYASGDVFGEYGAGGFAGYNDKEIADSFAAGAVSSSGKIVGGFVGKNNQYGALANVYGGAVSAKTAQFAGSAIGKNAGAFAAVGYAAGGGLPAIGNSPASAVGAANPQFTGMESFFGSGALASWSTGPGAWVFESGKLPAFTAESGKQGATLSDGVVSAIWANASRDARDVVLVVASYDGDGRMASVAADRLAVQPGSNGLLRAGAGSAAPAEGLTHRAFILDGGTYAPVARAFDLN